MFIKTKEKLDTAKMTAQMWLPLLNIENNKVYLKNSTAFSILKIEPVNILLMTEKEIKNLIENFAAVLNGLSGNFQFFTLSRPVELDNHLLSLNTLLKEETNFLKKNLLREYIKNISYVAASGELTERRYYLLYKTSIEENLDYELQNLINSLSSAEINVKILSDNDILDLNCLFFNPKTAYFEENKIDMSLLTMTKGEEKIGDK